MEWFRELVARRWAQAVKRERYVRIETEYLSIEIPESYLATWSAINGDRPHTVTAVE